MKREKNEKERKKKEGRNYERAENPHFTFCPFNFSSVFFLTSISLSLSLSCFSFFPLFLLFLFSLSFRSVTRSIYFALSLYLNLRGIFNQGIKEEEKSVKKVLSFYLSSLFFSSASSLSSLYTFLFPSYEELERGNPFGSN